MRKKEIGQTLVLVLILLAIGSLLVVPTMRLTSTSSLSSQVVDRHTKSLYACDAAQEYVLWKLTYDGFGSEFGDDGDTVEFNIDVCDVPVDITVVMRAVEGEGGIDLAGDDVIKPMKTVSPDTVPDGNNRTYTYTIRLEQLSNDNTVGLDAIYEILPTRFRSDAYVLNSSELSIDGGPWLPIPDPAIEGEPLRARLKWPADYDPIAETGTFSSDPFDVDHYFHGIRDFDIRQVKELRFQVTETLLNNSTYYNWVVLKPWNTMSGPQAPLTVGDGSNPVDGLLTMDKVGDPEIIQPGVETDILYTISINNIDGQTHMIQKVEDYLPPGFIYVGPTSGFTESDPQTSLEDLNGVERWVLTWTTDEFGGGDKQINSGETLFLNFWARTTKDVSGSYFNEFTVEPNTPLPLIFTDIGVTFDDFNNTYSWNTGGIIVPYYDSRTDGDEVEIDANLAMIFGGIAIKSWQVR
jgi:hypothetical protein